MTIEICGANRHPKISDRKQLSFSLSRQSTALLQTYTFSVEIKLTSRDKRHAKAKTSFSRTPTTDSFDVEVLYTRHKFLVKS